MDRRCIIIRTLEGYPNPYYGHARGTHKEDKTNSDPMKSMEMAGGTFGALAAYGRTLGCKCDPKITPDIAATTWKFSNLPGAYFASLYRAYILSMT